MMFISSLKTSIEGFTMKHPSHRAGLSEIVAAQAICSQECGQ